ncbi:DNA primase, partial [Escherichia coli]|uniref:hypothetical protein n=1 Tax=Escherichia coli TaxID=562 RepID=UPI002E30C0FC
AVELCVDVIKRQEVWACFTPENLEMVAYRYKGDREVRVACKPSDKDTLYMADDRQLKIIIPNPGGYRSGMQAKLFSASDLL